MTRYVLLCSALLLTASSLLAKDKDLASTVPAFAQAAALTATNVQAAFDSVQTAFCNAESLNYEVTYPGNGKNPSSVCQDPSTWITPASLEVRKVILQGLSQYASELSGVTTSSVNNVDSATTALGTSLTGLTTTQPFKTLSTKAAANLKLGENIFTTAVNALGNWLIGRKTKKALPGDIEAMDPTIQQISQLLVADIGVVGANQAAPTAGSGLRQDLWNQYGEQISSWNLYVRANYFDDKNVVKQGVAPDAAIAAVKQLMALVSQQRTADHTLAQVAATIKQMAQAHAELVESVKTKKSLTANLSGLLAEAERLNTYYQSLATSK